MPPDMPAAKLRPIVPSTATTPPVMYSQPWSPTPSTTARRARVAHGEALARAAADEQLARRSRRTARVADDDALPRLVARVAGGRTMSRPPERPLPT